MKVEFSHGFMKIFKKRFSHLPNIQEKFAVRLKLFVANPQNPVLQDHLLSGKLESQRAFSITGDIRVVYYVFEEVAYFVDIGTHNQVYGE